MPTKAEKIGQTIERTAVRFRRSSDNLLDSTQRELNRLNKWAANEARKVYDGVLTTLMTLPGTSIPRNSTDNLALVADLMQGLEQMQAVYRLRYGEIIRDVRANMMDLLVGREVRLEKALEKVGVNETRTTISADAVNIMQETGTKAFKQINVMLEKWKQYAYNIFYSGIIKGVPISAFKTMFFNPNGTIKIGSSLDEDSTYATMISITEQKTAFSRKQAEEQGWNYCWNSNPMDVKTKPECISASVAGVISEQEMAAEHGFPPRQKCRCEVVFTRPEWKSVNKGVNQAIEERRQGLVKELISAPRQMAKWKRAGKTIVPDEILRAQGNKMYKDISDKINLLTDLGAVPEFEFAGGDITGF